MKQGRWTGPVTPQMLVEELMELAPQAAQYFVLQGVNPVYCVGAYPDSLQKLLWARGVKDPQGFIEGLNTFLKTGAL